MKPEDAFVATVECEGCHHIVVALLTGDEEEFSTLCGGCDAPLVMCGWEREPRSRPTARVA